MEIWNVFCSHNDQPSSFYLCRAPISASRWNTCTSYLLPHFTFSTWVKCHLQLEEQGWNKALVSACLCPQGQRQRWQEEDKRQDCFLLSAPKVGHSVWSCELDQWHESEIWWMGAWICPTSGKVFLFLNQ